MRPIQALALTTLLLTVAVPASSDIYDVTVNTSPIIGTTGSLDFNFDPGPLVSQGASLQITNFATDGSLAGGPVLTGDVSGTLPSTLTFDNGTPFNDYFQGFTYGSSLSFVVNLYGPAISSPDGTSTSGSAFAFSMFSDPGGTMPVLTTNTSQGFAFEVEVNLDGATTPISFLPTTSVPEPAGMTLVLVVAAASFAALALRRCVGS